MHASILAAGASLLALTAAAPTAALSREAALANPKALVARTLEVAGVIVARQRAGLTKRDTSAVVSGSAAVTSINDNDGVGAGSNTNTPYSGDGSTGAGWPDQSAWGSFSDLFSANTPTMQISCEYFGQADDSADEISAIQSAIESVAAESAVDHRFILAVIMQESNGCVRVRTTGNGVVNPGLMQSHNGANSCNNNGVVQNPCPDDEITGMVHDGSVGTDSGDGLASLLNQAEGAGTSGAQTFYYAARLYNSGSVCDPGDLSNGCGATPSYASDVANRLTGWLGN